MSHKHEKSKKISKKKERQEDHENGSDDLTVTNFDCDFDDRDDDDATKLGPNNSATENGNKVIDSENLTGILANHIKLQDQLRNVQGERVYKLMKSNGDQKAVFAAVKSHN